MFFVEESQLSTCHRRKCKMAKPKKGGFLAVRVQRSHHKRNKSTNENMERKNKKPVKKWFNQIRTTNSLNY